MVGGLLFGWVIACTFAQTKQIAMETVDTYKQELLSRLNDAGLQNSVLADGLYGCSTASELLNVLRMNMTQWVLYFQVTGAELEKVFSQERLRQEGIYTGDMAVTVDEAYSFYAFGRASVTQKGDYCTGHFYEQSCGEIIDGKGRFYQQARGKAYEGSLIFAHQETTVIAYDQAQLTLMDRAKGTLYQQGSGIATGHATLYCHDNSYGFLTGHSFGWFLHNSVGQCEGNSQFLARHATDVEAYGQSTGYGREKATVSLADKAKLYLSPDFEGTIHQSNRMPIEPMNQEMLALYVENTVSRKQGLGR